MELLLNHSASLAVTDRQGASALHRAAATGKVRSRVGVRGTTAATAAQAAGRLLDVKISCRNRPVMRRHKLSSLPIASEMAAAPVLGLQGNPLARQASLESARECVLDVAINGQTASAWQELPAAHYRNNHPTLAETSSRFRCAQWAVHWAPVQLCVDRVKPFQAQR